MKRGQVTIFIIIGIVLVLLVGLIIFLARETTLFRPEQILPPEKGGVQKFVEDCVSSTARDGLGILGTQGGYIYLPQKIVDNPLSYIDRGLRIPHWQYFDENRIPSVSLMESHLSRYINERLHLCLQDFTPFSAEFDIIQQGEVSTTTTITDGGIIYELSLPLDVRDKEGNIVTEITEYRVDTPVKLKQLHAAGSSILERASQEERFEKITIDLIALDPEIPLSGFDVSCSSKTWDISKTAEKLKTLLRTNIPKLRITKLLYNPIPDDQPYLGVHYVWDGTELGYDDVGASFEFVDRRFQFNARPNNGGLMRSSVLQTTEFAEFLCLQQWKFTYDVQYPVIVSLKDQVNNFALSFAFDVSVKSNQPARQRLGDSTFDFVPVGATKNAFCNNRRPFEMTISTFDNVSDPTYGETYEPINDVNITFTCLKFTCEMGESSYENRGASAELTTNFPYCPNGVLRGFKDGYKPAQIFTTTTKGGQASLYLTPIKKIPSYTVVKHELISNTSVGINKPLEANQRAFITLSYQSNTSKIHETFASYPFKEGQQGLELLAGGNFPYTVNVMLLEENDLVGVYQGVWTPDWFDLQDASSLEFHVVSKDTFASDMERFEFLSNAEQFSKLTPGVVIK